MKNVLSIFAFVIIFISSVCFSNESSSNAIQNFETEIYVNKDVKVTFSGDILEFYTAQSDRVYPITYNDSTYLPIRAISSLYNIPILWDGFKDCIYLDSDGQIDSNACKSVTDFKKEGLFKDVALINQTIKVYYQKELIEFFDVNKNKVYPISYKYTTYLPVRAIANLFDCYVDYDFENNTVLLGGKKNRFGTNNLPASIITDESDNTEFNYIYTNYNSNEPISGDIIFYIAGFNDSLCWGINLYEEDPITGRNIYEDELEKIYEEIESQSQEDDFRRMLLTQKYNLDYYLPDYYKKPSGDYYFEIDNIFFLNSPNESNMAKDLKIIIDDDYIKEVTLDASNKPQTIKINYYQYDISKPVKICIKVLNNYNEEIEWKESGETDIISPNPVYFADIIPYLVSNIPQGR